MKRILHSLAKQEAGFAIDLLGHRNSSDAKDLDCYGLASYADLVLFSAKEPQVDRDVFVRWGSGDHLLLEAPDELDASEVVLVGTPPLSSKTW